MNRLIIETSTPQSSIALFDGDKLLVEETFPGGRGPVSRFFSILQRILTQVESIEEIIVGVGPGSYSGIRIGISAAIGLQLARGVVARGIHSALGYPGADFQVLLDGRGSYIYSAIRSNQLVTHPIHCTRSELDGKMDSALPIYTPDYIGGFDLSPTFPLASNLGQRLCAAELPLVPLYLKPPHITAPKAK